ncbi:hypothetical protein JK359_15465 [Streptomyces actinomycinicus]|uniref:Uncharacterized protein n=1 Tax=Streptomyces actinomycinicus TaxID=1695166 RepID=A0A937JPD6_9ACTN|nr:hypothetical protein [Streptomyces actinomycinicus]MBL1083367.1 hypothetical protein [Streptomyces actinomycinicus]
MLHTGTVRTTAWTRGRRTAVTTASAAVVVLGGVLAACGGAGPGGGYTAVGAGPGGPTAVAPTGSVTLVPLDGPHSRGTGGEGASPGRRGTANGRPLPSGSAGTPSSPAAAPTPRHTPGGHGGNPVPGTPGPSGGQDGPTTPPAASPSPTAGHGKPPTPADLSWGDPADEDGDKRWCQSVTVAFHNSGGEAVRSGEVTFGTHIIGALGIDWGTVESTVELPVPIAPGARKEPTWTVCVDAWRVPLGMHIETRDVSVRWE